MWSVFWRYVMNTNELFYRFNHNQGSVSIIVNNKHYKHETEFQLTMQ